MGYFFNLILYFLYSKSDFCKIIFLFSGVTVNELMI